MRALIASAALLLLAACGSNVETSIDPVARPSSAAPSPTVSYDPAWKTTFYTEDGPGVPGTDRTYVFTVGGTGAEERLRPGMWATVGGTCDYTAGKKTGRVFTVDSEGWSRFPAEVRLEPGATFTVVHLAGFRNGGCNWTWDRALD